MSTNWEECQVREGEYPADESLLETPWTFWYDKKTTDKKESDQYMEGLRQLGSFGTIEGFYRHYTFLLRPSELPRDHNVLLFRKGYKPMWEEFPEGGCWIVRIKRKSQSYVNHMWENLLLACIGEAFEMPDVVGCVLSTRVKDDVLSVWNLSNRDNEARFRIGEKLKEVLDLDMNALIQYKDHMQSLQDYSTYRNARNYMFAPSPSVTPQQGTMETPMMTGLDDLDGGMLPPALVDEMLPPAAIDSEAFGGFSSEPAATVTAPPKSTGKSPALSPEAPPWHPPASAATPAAPAAAAKEAAPQGGEAAKDAEDKSQAQGTPSPDSKPQAKSWAAIAARAAQGGGSAAAPKGKGKPKGGSS
eukprot:TRINITY_DN48693_c0_g1_i1.p1 TRINITY_DN48693_c0_g1~~TRINITY_DN48693_c0_g1_i1.p1  ORF type:complete len:359 (+),score=72.98 TRINITY_DN48693_c0_g1_i1:149-1225(+)